MYDVYTSRTGTVLLPFLATPAFFVLLLPATFQRFCGGDIGFRLFTALALLLFAFEHSSSRRNRDRPFDEDATTAKRDRDQTCVDARRNKRGPITCSRYLIQSIEAGRKTLSARIASEISRKTGVDLAWLTNDDPSADMIRSCRYVHTPARIFNRAQASLRTLEGSHHLLRNLQLGVAFDLLHRLLAASRLKGKDDVDGFVERLEKFIKSELEHHTALEDAVYGERRRAKETARKSGRVIALSFLTPFDDKPFHRGRERLATAIAAFTARRVRSENELECVEFDANR